MINNGLRMPYSYVEEYYIITITDFSRHLRAPYYENMSDIISPLRLMMNMFAPNFSRVFGQLLRETSAPKCSTVFRVANLVCLHGAEQAADR